MNQVAAQLLLPSLDEATNLEPLAVDQSAAVGDVVDQLNRHGATGALVMAGGLLAGVFTVRDIVRLAAGGVNPAAQLVGAAARPVIGMPRSHPEGVLAALRLLAQHDVRHLVSLNDDGSPAGLISYESIAAAITPAMLMRLRTVAEAMDADAPTAGPDQTLLEIARAIDESRVGCVVVAVPGEAGGMWPLGLITECDIARAYVGRADVASTPARDLIALQPVSVPPDATLWDAHQAMERAHVRRLLVTGPAGELLGVITQGALLPLAGAHELGRAVDLLQRGVELRSPRPLVQMRPAAAGGAGGRPRPSTRLLLVDDNPVFLQLISKLLTSRGFNVAGAAGGGQAAIEQARALQPDIILMDVEMPGVSGLEATSAIMDERPDARIVILTVAEDDSTLFDAVRRGAAGYLLKDIDIDRLGQYLDGLMRGEAALSPGLAQRVLSALASKMQSDGAAQPGPASILTTHQIRILTLLARGNTYKEIGRILGYSERAIKYHTGEAIRQLRLNDRAEAIAYTRAHMQRGTWPQVSDI